MTLGEFKSIPVPVPQSIAWKTLRRGVMQDLRKTGMKVESVAEIFAVNPSTVLYAVNPDRRQKCHLAAIEASRKRGSVELSPVDQVIAKLSELKEIGIGRRSIHAICGLAPRTYTRIRSGLQKRIYPETVAKVLAIDESCMADRGLVRSTATWNLLQELIEDGWTEGQLADALGVKGAHRTIQVGLTHVSARKAMKVRKMYDDIQAGKVQRVVTRTPESPR